MQQGVLCDEGNKRVVLGEGYGSDILKHKPYTWLLLMAMVRLNLNNYLRGLFTV